jgi:hypothetical protein
MRRNYSRLNGSEGGHRRYSRYQLRVAARARELVDGGTALDAACRIIILRGRGDHSSVGVRVGV